MLSIRPSIKKPSSPSSASCSLNLLPCRIAQTGPCDASSKHWIVETDDKAQQTAYFRGRKLVSAPLVLPSTHIGAVLDITQDILPTSNGDGQHLGLNEDGDFEPDADLPIEVKAVDELVRFDRISVWGHEMMVNKMEDVVIKGVEEWVSVSGRMNDWEEE